MPAQRWCARPAAHRLAAEATVVVAALLATWSSQPKPQAASYHQFSGDDRPLLGIPHGGANVVSNAAIAVPGVTGLWVLARCLLHRGRCSGGKRGSSGNSGGGNGSGPGRRKSSGSAGRRGSSTAPDSPSTPEALSLAASFLGALIIAVGSCLYHLAPSNESLVLDRVGIAICLPSFFTALICERRDPLAGLLALPLLVGAAVGTVLHWAASEVAGQGDLRFYNLMQNLTVLGSVYLVLCYPPLPPRRRDLSRPFLLACIGLYAVATVAEALDAPLYRLTGTLISGHTLKHLLAGGSGWQMVLALRTRCSCCQQAR